MSTDFSWQRAVGAYEDLLQALTGHTDADAEDTAVQAAAQSAPASSADRAADTRQRRTRQARGSMPMPI